nr:hypothetical protein [Actinomycetota bacterium]
ILGVVFLGEMITAPLLAGGALVLLGLTLFTGPAAFGMGWPHGGRWLRSSARATVGADSV